ncbi:MAG: hypothetical protein JWN92_1139, partial [Candidatus Acidoferrum typicum]|nr:hypothetical protein [Candidatus Acidoferrum typicum]
KARKKNNDQKYMGVFRHVGNGIGDCGSTSGAGGSPDGGSGWNGWWDRNKYCERVSNARRVEPGGSRKEGIGCDCFSGRCATGPRRAYTGEPSTGGNASGKCGCTCAAALAVDDRTARNGGAS